MLATGGRGGQDQRDPKTRLGSSDTVHMKPAHGGISSGCYQRNSLRTPGRGSSSTSWNQLHQVASPIPQVAGTSETSRENDTPRRNVPAFATSSPARISYREKDELWCTEPELPPLRKPASNFAPNRMDELLGILRSDVRSLKAQGKCIAKQIWLLYVTFEDFLQVRHPNHLRKLLFHQTVKSASSFSQPLQAGCLLDDGSNTSLVTSPVEKQPCGNTESSERDLADKPRVPPRDCYSEETCDIYKSPHDYSIEDICDCCERENSVVYNEVDVGRYCEENLGQSLSEDICCCCCCSNNAAGGCSDETGDSCRVDVDNSSTEDTCAYCVEESSNLSPHTDHYILDMPRSRHGSPGTTSSGYDTDQDYVTWNQTRMSNSKSVTALLANSKLKQIQFKCKNGKIHTGHSSGDEFIIKADDLYHQNYACSSENEFPVSRKVPHNISMHRHVATGDGQHCKRENTRKGHPKTCRKNTCGEHSKLHRVKKTMKNIISDLESERELDSKEPGLVKIETQTESESYNIKVSSSGFVPQVTTEDQISPETLQQIQYRHHNSRDSNHILKPVVSRDTKRENVLHWQCRVQDLDQVSSNDYNDLDKGKYQGPTTTADTTPIRVNNVGADTLLDSETHLHSPDASDLDYRNTHECSNMSTPYHPCSTGSISSDSGMASFATGEYSTDYDIYSWGSPVHAIDKNNTTSSNEVPSEQEENVYETIPDELVNTDDEGHQGFNCAFSFYRSNNKRSSICSDTTNHTYASIDANSVTSDYESPKPPALPARNYRRMTPLTPIQLARNQQGSNQLKTRTPNKKHLHLDDIVKASDIVDMSGPHMYTVNDVLESFERLAGGLPSEPHVEGIPEAIQCPRGKVVPENYTKDRYPPRVEQAAQQGSIIERSFRNGSVPPAMPRYVKPPSNTSLCVNGDGDVKNRETYNRDHYTCLDTPVDPLMTPVKYHRGFHTQTNTRALSHEHKYMTPHPCSNSNGHMTPVKDNRIAHNANHYNARENDWQCLSGNNVSIFELRGTYC